MDQEVGNIQHAEWNMGTKYSTKRMETKQRTW